MKTISQSGKSGLTSGGSRFAQWLWLLVVAFFSAAATFAAAPVLTPPSNTTISEDAGRTNLTFTVTDADTPSFAVIVRATSSNTALVSAVHCVVVGSGTSRTVGLTPTANANGTSTITLVATDGTTSVTNSFVLTVSAVDDKPVVGAVAKFAILEDAGSTNKTFSISDIDTTISSVTVSASSSNTNLVTAAVTGSSTNRTLTLTTATNANGAATISYVATDGTSSVTNSFVLTVTPVNDVPSFALSTTSITIGEDAGSYSLANFATNISAGPSNESTQTVSFVATTTNKTFFSVLPAVSSSGTLTFKTATNKYGTNVVSIVVKDNGGTANGGKDTSAAQTLTLIVTNVNDAPVIGTIANFAINEDAGTTNRAVTLADSDSTISAITLTASSSNTNLVTVATSGTTTNRTLTITTVTNANGSATISLIANDGTSTATNSFVLTVNGVNDVPSFNLSTTSITIGEDAGTYSLANFATNIVVGPSNESSQTNFFVVTSSSPTFFAVAPAVSPSGTLTFKTATNKYGTNVLSILVKDSGGTANGGKDTSAAQTLTLIVTNGNDAPVIGTIANFAINEDAGTTNKTILVTDVDSAISGVTLTASSSNTNLVTVATSGTSANRTLAITTVTNANGSATITLIADDGAASSTNTFVLTVNAVNDVPSFNLSTTSITVGEDSGSYSLANFATNIVVGPSNESSQTNSFVVTTTNAAFFAVAPAVSPTGTLTFKTATNRYGTNIISIVVKDSGGITFGGKDTSVAQTLTLVVTNVNDAPVISGIAAFAINEDASVTNKTVILTDIDTAIASVTLTASSSNTNLVTVATSGTSTNRTLAITTVTNANGSATITLIADDGSATTTNSFVLTVNAVNDVPSFSLSSTSITIGEDAGSYSLANFATNIVVGPSNESSQTNSFVVTTTNAAFFAVAPAISATGTLTFKTATNKYGTNVLSIVMKDSGGITFGGKDTSAAQTLTLVVTNVNDAPVISGIAAFAINEDAGVTNKTVTLSDIDTSIASVTLTATSSDTNLVTVATSGTSTNRTLAITTVTNANGSATITLVANDGTTSSTNSFVLTVNPVNDMPSFSLSTTSITVGEDAGSYSLANFATNIVVGPSNESSQTNSFVVTTTNATFFTVAPAISASGTLTFKTATNKFGTNVLSIVIKDSGGTANGGKDTSAAQTLTLVVTNVNDAPVISGIANFAINEDAGLTNKTVILSDIDTAIASVTLTATSSDTNLVTVATSGTSTNRTLAITTVTNAFGTATITLIADDGSATSTNAITLTVNSVNDVPSFNLSTTSITLAEDSGSYTLANFATNIVVGPSNESSQTNSFVVTTTNSAFFAVAPAVSASGTLTFKTATNVYGTNVLSIVVKDSGGVANGGKDTSAAQTLTLVVTNVNDAPVISGISAFAINEDSGTTNKTVIVTDIDSAVSGVTLTATSSDTNLVTVATSGTTTNRTLTITTLTNAFGTANITLVASDGSDSSTNVVVLTVNAVNDQPSFSLTTNSVTVTKFAATTTVSGIVTNVVLGPTNESTQTYTFSVSTTNAAFFAVAPTVSTNGTLSFKAADTAGSTTISIQLVDSGGIANGGVATATPQTLTITVPDNPYTYLAGGFNGLFYETNAVTHASSGFINFTLGNKGLYTGYVLVNGGSNVFSGQFDVSGNSTATITRTNGDLTLTMAVDLSTNWTETATGTVSNGSWTAPLMADRATFSATVNPTALAGAYTVQFPGSGSPASSPGGNGYGTVDVDADGTISLSGKLADGTSISQAVPVAKTGSWPLYLPLYSGKGSVLGWLTFTNEATSNISGDASWIKLSTAGGSIYTNGFTNEITITGSTWVAPTSGAALNLSSGSVILSGGNLAASLTNSITLNSDSSITVTSGTNQLSLTISLSDGTISGKFIDPTSLLTNHINGVLLQSATNAVGYFLGTDQSGALLLK